MFISCCQLCHASERRGFRGCGAGWGRQGLPPVGKRQRGGVWVRECVSSLRAGVCVRRVDVCPVTSQGLSVTQSHEQGMRSATPCGLTRFSSLGLGFCLCSVSEGSLLSGVTKSRASPQRRWALERGPRSRVRAGCRHRCCCFCLSLCLHGIPVAFSCGLSAWVQGTLGQCLGLSRVSWLIPFAYRVMFI